MSDKTPRDWSSITSNKTVQKLLENQQKFLEKSKNPCSEISIGFNDIMFPMIRAAYPSNLSSMISVQPMTWPYNDMTSQVLSDAGITTL